MKTIWYIEDDQEMINAVRRMLDLLHFSTRSYYLAREAAKALLSGERPDIFLLDINMPETSGMDLLEFIRSKKEWDDIPIIMLSSEITDQQVDKAFDAGADGYLFKPIVIDELEMAISKAFENRKV